MFACRFTSTIHRTQQMEFLRLCLHRTVYYLRTRSSRLARFQKKYWTNWMCHLKGELTTCRWNQREELTCKFGASYCHFSLMHSSIAATLSQPDQVINWGFSFSEIVVTLGTCLDKHGTCVNLSQAVLPFEFSGKIDCLWASLSCSCLLFFGALHGKDAGWCVRQLQLSMRERPKWQTHQWQICVVCSDSANDTRILLFSPCCADSNVPAALLGMAIRRAAADMRVLSLKKHIQL